MDAPVRPRRPVLFVAAQVGLVVLVHGAITAVIVRAIGATAERLGPLPQYWAVITLVPALAWTGLVIARAAAWRRASNFWLAGAAAIVGILAFIFGFVLLVTPLEFPGIGLGMLASSWILIAVALAVAFLSNAVGHSARERRPARRLR